MNTYSSLCFNQNLMAAIGGFSPQAILRCIKELNITNINIDSVKSKKYNFEDTRAICSNLINKKKFTFKKTHVFYNLKGGTGKTSICYQLGLHLSIIGFNILFIDCDPQGHLSTALNFPEGTDFYTLYDVMINSIPLKDSIKEVLPGVNAIPSNLSLSRLEVPLSQKPRREEKLKELLFEVKDQYDFIFMDTNPYISTLNLNALVAADHINFVCETAPFSLFGLRVLLEEANKFFDDMKLPLSYKIIANKYEGKTVTSQEVLGYLRSHYKNNVMESVVRRCEDFNISSKEKLPIAAFSKKKSIALEDVIDLMHEFLNLI